MSVGKWILLVVAIVIVVLLAKQIPTARRYLRIKKM
jgi:hypothetical protein